MSNAAFTFPLIKQTELTAARMLRGHRFAPLKDGWLLVYEDAKQPPHAGLIDELCIVMTVDGDIRARILRRGRREGTWDLLAGNADQELDVALTWAAKVDAIIPFDPTPEQMEALQRVR